MGIRRKLYDIIQPDNGKSVASRIFDVIITTLILTSVVIVFSVTFELPTKVIGVLNIFEDIASIVFSIEYLLRIVTADFVYPGKGPIKARISYILSPMAIIDLVAILPFWLPMFLPGSMLGMRAFRLVRLLRILKLNRYFDGSFLAPDVLGRTRRPTTGVL